MVDHLRHQHHYTFVISEGGCNNKENLKALQKLWPEVDIIYYPFVWQLTCPSFFYEKTRRVLFRAIAPKSRKYAVESVVRPYGEWFSRHHIAFVEKIIQAKKIDLIQVEFYEDLPWANYLPAHIKKIFIHHELGFMRKQRLLSHLYLTKIEQQQLIASKTKELAHLEQYDAIITVTQTDKEILQHVGLKRPVYVSTLAINTVSSAYSAIPYQLAFVGGYGHLPNKEGMDWFLKEVAPLLRNGSFTLNLIGNSWPNSYSACKDIRVDVKGFVENLSDVALGNIMIVPILSGSGMRMKILEAAAMSLPIVTTTVGVEGLNFIDGESCIIADTPQDFADAILRLENDKQLRRSLGENANKVYEAKYHPSVLACERNKIYEQIMTPSVGQKWPMADIDFSIIIPAYNDSCLFQQALDSVRRQKDVNVEIIIVDDSDKNNDIERLVHDLHDKRIFYEHHSPSLGAVPNWNRGLSLCHGQHIVLVHHDESFVSDNHLKTILHGFERGFDVVVSNIEIHKGNTIEHGNFPSLLKRFFITTPSLLFIANIIGPCACVALKRKGIVPFDEHLHWLVDIEWYYRLFQTSKTLYLPQLFVQSLHGHSNQISQTINIRHHDQEDSSYLKKKYRSKPFLLLCLHLKDLTQVSGVKKILKKVFK